MQRGAAAAGRQGQRCTSARAHLRTMAAWWRCEGPPPDAYCGCYIGCGVAPPAAFHPCVVRRVFLPPVLSAEKVGCRISLRWRVNV